MAGGRPNCSWSPLGEGLGAIVALGCNPFADPTRDGTYAGDLAEDEATGTLRLSRNIGNHLVYGGYSRGYKAGGFNMDRSGLTSPILTGLTGTPQLPGIDQWIFLPETVDTYEVGAKISLDDWRGCWISACSRGFRGLPSSRHSRASLSKRPTSQSGHRRRGDRGARRGSQQRRELWRSDLRRMCDSQRPEHGFPCPAPVDNRTEVTGVGGRYRSLPRWAPGRRLSYRRALHRCSPTARQPGFP